MTITPVHHVPMKPEYNSPYSAAFAVEDARLVFFSGCCAVPVYHAHPHDAEAEKEWLSGGIGEQTERTFAHIKEVLGAAGADFADVVKLTIYMTDMSGQDALNEISARVFGRDNPPARTLVKVAALAHPGMLIEIDGTAAVAKGAG